MQGKPQGESLYIILSGVERCFDKGGGGGGGALQKRGLETHKHEARGVAKHRTRGKEMLLTLAISWQASAMRGEEARGTSAK